MASDNTSSSSPYAATLISASLTSGQPILRFGSFTLKSGRQSPYFFNFGLFNTGALLLSLSGAFADAIIAAFPSIGLAPAAPAATAATAAPAAPGSLDDNTPQVLFGPAYKGIPLVAAISTELARRGRDIGYSYNRKEAKTHGEGGSIVGADLRGKRVLIIDDVITAGTAIRQAHQIVVAEHGHTVGIFEALDREERGAGFLSTVQEIEQELGLPVFSVVKMRDIVAWLDGQNRDPEKLAMEAYRQEYGI